MANGDAAGSLAAEFAKRARAERNRLGLTQHDLAQRTGMAGDSAVCRIERMQQSVTLEQAQEIARGMGFRLEVTWHGA